MAAQAQEVLGMQIMPESTLSPESELVPTPRSGPRGCFGTAPAGRPTGGRQASASRVPFDRSGTDTAPGGS